MVWPELRALPGVEAAPEWQEARLINRPPRRPSIGRKPGRIDLLADPFGASPFWEPSGVAKDPGEEAATARGLGWRVAPAVPILLARWPVGDDG